MSLQVAATGRPAAGMAAWPYVEYMARWERQVERRQLFLRSYHFSRDDEPVSRSPRTRARRVVWVGLRRLRRAAATGLRRLRARLRLCFGWATRRRSRTRAATGFRYGRLSGKARSTVCFWR